MMEKKTSFLSLVYREYCITKKSVFGNVVSIVMAYGICIMYSISARFGNIAKIDSTSDLAALVGLMTPCMHMMGIWFSFTLFMSSADGAVADLKNKTWALYRKGSPIGAFRLALARGVYQLIALLLSAGASLLYILIDSLISEKSIVRGDIGMMAALGAIVVLMGVSMTLCVEFMKSTDKGMLLAMGVIFAVLAAVILPRKTEAASEAMTIDELTAMWASLADKTSLFLSAILLMFAAEVVLLALLYKRREK